MSLNKLSPNRKIFPEGCHLSGNFFDGKQGVNLVKRTIEVNTVMTDAARNLTTPATTPNLAQQAYTLLKQISKAESIEGAPAGGVSFAYGPNSITGTFTFPIERVDSPEGDIVRIVSFTK